MLSNVLSACADTDQDAWIAWLGEAFQIHPSIEKTGNSGGPRFSTIDVKLANALNAMINTSGDSGRGVGLEIKVMTLDMARSSPPKVMKGRQIVAMILESFRSSTQTDLMFTGKHLYEMAYPGDAKLNLFRNQWIHILSAMREDDKPRDLALRDTLFDKIKGSTSMQFEIRYYKSLREGHHEKMQGLLPPRGKGRIVLTKPRESVSCWDLRHLRPRNPQSAMVNPRMTKRKRILRTTLPRFLQNLAPKLIMTRGKERIGERKEKVKGSETRVGDDLKVKTRSQSHVVSISRRVVVAKGKNASIVMQRNMVPERTAKVPEMGKGETAPEEGEVHLRNPRVRSHVSFSLGQVRSRRLSV